MVPAERTVTVADWPRQARGAEHRRAGCGADAFRRSRARAAEFDPLNPGTTPTRPRTIRPRLEAVRRESTFDEVVGGLDDSTALFEARRCMSCGSCFACDNCYGVCPDNAVIKLDPPGSYAYDIDLDFCKGCGLCAAECPCGAIEMEPELI